MAVHNARISTLHGLLHDGGAMLSIPRSSGLQSGNNAVGFETSHLMFCELLAHASLAYHLDCLDLPALLCLP